MAQVRLICEFRISFSYTFVVINSAVEIKACRRIPLDEKAMHFCSLLQRRETKVAQKWVYPTVRSGCNLVRIVTGGPKHQHPGTTYRKGDSCTYHSSSPLASQSPVSSRARSVASSGAGVVEEHIEQRHSENTPRPSGKASCRFTAAKNGSSCVVPK